MVSVMRMTVYIDVLLLSNFWVDAALLRASAALTHTPLPRGRWLLGGLVGAAGALAIFLPPMPLFLCMLGRFCLAICMTLTAFGLHGVRFLLRQTAVLFLTSLFFCGIVYAISLWRMPFGFYAQNTVFYADLSLLVLLFGATAAAALSVICARRSGRLPHRAYRLHLRIRDCDFCIPALADTGSTLRDAFSGLPVIICSRDALQAWISHYPNTADAAAECKGFRLIPVQTVAGQTVLPAFQPDSAAIAHGSSAELPLDVMIAVSDADSIGEAAIVPACCVEHT